MRTYQLPDDSLNNDSSSLDASSTVSSASSNAFAASSTSTATLRARRAASSDAAFAFLNSSSASRHCFSIFFASTSAFFCAASRLYTLARASVSDLFASCSETFASAILAFRASSFSRTSPLSASFRRVFVVVRSVPPAIPLLLGEGRERVRSIAGGYACFRLALVDPPATAVGIDLMPGTNEASDSKPGGSTS
jgi:hypothetical protein